MQQAPQKTQATIQASITSIIEQIKITFLSENFAHAFFMLRDCMNSEEVSDQIIYDLLKGKIGYNDLGDSVEFGKEFIDEDYSQEIKEVLENYDYLIEIKNLYYQINECFKFELAHIADTNPWITELKANAGKLVPCNRFKYFKEISSMASDAGSIRFSLADYFIYNDGAFYLLSRYDRKLIAEAVTIYENPLDATAAYKENSIYF